MDESELVEHITILSQQQNCKSGRAFRVRFGLEIDKPSGVIPAWHKYLPCVLACYVLEKRNYTNFV